MIFVGYKEVILVTKDSKISTTVIPEKSPVIQRAKYARLDAMTGMNEIINTIPERETFYYTGGQDILVYEEK